MMSKPRGQNTLGRERGIRQRRAPFQRLRRRFRSSFERTTGKEKVNVKVRGYEGHFQAKHRTSRQRYPRQENGHSEPVLFTQNLGCIRSAFASKSLHNKLVVVWLYFFSGEEVETCATTTFVEFTDEQENNES